MTLDIVEAWTRSPSKEDIDGPTATPLPPPSASASPQPTPSSAVTPEYNGTMPAVLNNAIDWISPLRHGAIVGKLFGVSV